MDNTSEKGNNKIRSSIIKWGIILALVIFAGIKNRDFVASAIEEIERTTNRELFLCLLLGNMYFVFEAFIMTAVTKTGENGLSWWRSFVCGYMCAFYRLATLGSGNGIAQLYYFNINGIEVSRGTGIALSQYTFQKITIGLFGIVSFAMIVLMGDDRIKKYSDYMLLGTAVIALVCVFLMIITVSKTISDWLIRLGRRIVKPTSRLYAGLDKAENSIRCLQEQGRTIWKNKLLFVRVIILNVCKFSCWYAIPGILFIRHFDVQLSMCIFLMAICNMIGCVMIAPSGVGTLEFVFAIFFSAIISDNNAIAAAIILYRFFTWLVPFAIGIIPAVLVRKKR